MKRTIYLFIAIVIAMGLALVLIPEDDEVLRGRNSDGENEWVVYWYLCGSDLETEYGEIYTSVE